MVGNFCISSETELYLNGTLIEKFLAVFKAI